MAALVRFADCETSVFISYALADDEMNNSWITNFTIELNRDLTAAMAREPIGRAEMPRPYLSKYTGPVAGSLGPQLRAQVNSAFAMIIVVGEKYASSTGACKSCATFKTPLATPGSTPGSTSWRCAPHRCTRWRPSPSGNKPLASAARCGAVFLIPMT